jgi:cell wall-associated NlpC family hydrolase
MKRKNLAFSGLFVLILFLSFSSNVFATQYKVKNGDTLYSISKKFGVSVNQIKETNNLQKSGIKKKQVLSISTKKSSKRVVKRVVKSKSKPVYYTVRKGDTLLRIAKKTHQPMKKIMALNHVNSKSLRVGQKLVLAKPAYKPEESIVTQENEDIEESEDSPDIDSEDADQEVLNINQQNEQSRKEELLGKWNSPDEVQLFVKVATGFIGAPYRFGGSSLKGIDCSSFVQKIYRIFDVTLPRNAAQQSKVGINITRENLTEGDLVFFHTNRSLGHVGIYIGNNEFVHASSKSKVVRIDSLDTPYYQKRFQRAVRVKGLDGNGA